MIRAGLDPSRPCGHKEWEVMQACLPTNCTIVVVAPMPYDQIVYYGRPEAPNVLGMYYKDDHYHAISRVPAFLGKRYICPLCHQSSHSKLRHRCKLTCSYCNGGGNVNSKGQCVSDGGGGQYCEECNNSSLPTIATPII